MFLLTRKIERCLFTLLFFSLVAESDFNRDFRRVGEVFGGVDHIIIIVIIIIEKKRRRESNTRATAKREGFISEKERPTTKAKEQ